MGMLRQCGQFQVWSLITALMNKPMFFLYSAGMHHPYQILLWKAETEIQPKKESNGFRGWQNEETEQYVILI